MSDLSRNEALFPPGLLENRTSARLALLLAAVLAGLALPRLFQTGQFSGRTIGTYSTLWLILLGAACLLALAHTVLLALSLTRFGARLEGTARGMFQRLSKFGIANLFGFGLPWIFFVLIVLWRYEKHFTNLLPRVWIFWLACAIGAVFLVAWQKRISYFWALLATAAVYGAGVRVLGFLPEVSAYPFSLGWSEASRFYYASLPFSRQLYGQSIELSPLHPSRYLILSLPFLFARDSIWLLRFWQVFLWIAFSLATGLTLACRFWLRAPGGSHHRAWTALVIAGWAFLFMLQGPVYYHLHLCLLPVLLFFDSRRFVRSLLIVVLASLWAGISRVNWIPVPAMVAAALYFVERPVSCVEQGAGFRRWTRYLAPPLAWGAAGLAAALASQALYVLISGHEDPSAFGSTYTSALLWYRLLPSPTYPMGVLPAILLVSAPLLIFLIGSFARSRGAVHPLRLIGIGAILLVLFAGGLVVSTKIGGGSNIHNLDAFLVLLLVTGAAVWFQRTAVERNQAPLRPWRPWGLVVLLVLLPVCWNLDIGDPFVRRNFTQANADLEKLTAMVEEYSAQGEVLFITQRQLVVFQMIPGVPLTPEYELLMLSEMAISNNQPYLKRFQNDLEQHRFSMIVSDNSQWLRDPTVDDFAEENNAWVIHIGQPLYRSYESLLFFDTQGIDVLIPRQ